MIYPLVRELAAEKIPVAVTCRVLGFSKQAFYAWCKNPVSRRDWDDAHLINAAYDIHADDPAFGQRIWSVFAKKTRPEPQGRAPGARRPGRPEIHRDRAPRHLADRHHRAHTAESKLYLCAIKDVYSGRIVGYSIDSRMEASLAVAALRNAIIRRDPVGTVVHSDRGSQGGFNWSSQLNRPGESGGPAAAVVNEPRTQSSAPASRASTLPVPASTTTSVTVPSAPWTFTV
jgi:transposase InsO family protein